MSADKVNHAKSITETPANGIVSTSPGVSKSNKGTDVTIANTITNGGETADVIRAITQLSGANSLLS